MNMRGRMGVIAFKIKVLYLIGVMSVSFGCHLCPVHEAYSATTINLIENNLYSTNIYMTPDTNRIIYLEGGSNSNSKVKMFNAISDEYKFLSSQDAIPVFGEQWFDLASNNYFCWLDKRNTHNRYSDIYVHQFDSINSELKITNHPSLILDVSILDHYISWIEISVDYGHSLYYKDLSSSRDSIRIYDFNKTSSASAALHTFSYKNTCYIIFEDRSNGTTKIILYNINSNEMIVVADTENIEICPRYQEGCIFYQKINKLDPYKLEDNLSAGTIECYKIDDQSTSTIYAFSKDSNISVISNIYSRKYLIFYETDIENQQYIYYAYILNDQSVKILFKTPINSKILINQNTCHNDTLIYSKSLTDDNYKYNLHSYNIASETHTDIFDNNDSRINARFFNGKGIYVSVKFGIDPNTNKLIIVSKQLYSFVF